MTEATGEALDAGVAATDNVTPFPTPADGAAAKAAAIAEADRIVEASKAKVAVQEEHLAGAQAALELAVADREGLN